MKLYPIQFLESSNHAPFPFLLVPNYLPFLVQPGAWNKPASFLANLLAQLAKLVAMRLPGLATSSSEHILEALGPLCQDSFVQLAHLDSHS